MENKKHMKFILTTLLISSSLLTWSQEIQAKVSGNIFGIGKDSVYIAQLEGDHYVNFIGGKLKKNGDFSLKTTLPANDYYVFRIGNTHISLILRDSSDIKIYGDGNNLGQFTNIINSDESSSMNNYLKNLAVWNAKSDSAVKALQADATKKNEINQYMGVEYKKFQSIQQTYISQNPNSAALFPILGAIDPNKDMASYESIITQLNISFGQSPTIKAVTKNFEDFKVEKFANDPMAPGKIAPDFEERMLDSVTMMKLSDLRGQIVLLDFWASWCGPCRRENPAVVKLYEKYKEEGFTIMSVSLDKDRAKWQAAITKDNLSWPNHVSDLGAWSSRVPKLYGVRGIPFTVLIDKEGKIIRTKLRAAELQIELKRIFGH